MEDNDRIRLRANYEYLVDNVTVNDISAALFSRGTLNDDDLEVLNHLSSRKRQAAKRLLSILPRKGPTAFQCFCVVLREREHAFVADKLMDTDPAKYPALQAVDEVDFPLPDETNIKQLRQQLAIQADLLQRYQQDVQLLRDTLDGHEQRTVAIKDKCQQLEQAMHMRPSQGDGPMNFLEDFVARSGQPPRRRPLSGRLTDPIARALGVDVVHYMTASILNKPLERPCDVYSKTMRRTVKELATKNRHFFNSFMKNINKVDGLETLANVTDAMFADGSVNWGRIVVLYAYGGSLARYCALDCGEETVDMIAEFLGFYVARKLGQWIDDNNGWVIITIYDRLFTVFLKQDFVRRCSHSLSTILYYYSLKYDFFT